VPRDDPASVQQEALASEPWPGPEFRNDFRGRLGANRASPPGRWPAAAGFALL